jgi:hypothetical protein
MCRNLKASLRNFWPSQRVLGGSSCLSGRSDFSVASLGPRANVESVHVGLQASLTLSVLTWMSRSAAALATLIFIFRCNTEKPPLRVLPLLIIWNFPSLYPLHFPTLYLLSNLPLPERGRSLPRNLLFAAFQSSPKLEKKIHKRLKVSVFWEVALCGSVDVYKYFGRTFFCTEDGLSRFLRNVGGIRLPKYTESPPQETN